MEPCHSHFDLGLEAASFLRDLQLEAGSIPEDTSHFAVFLNDHSKVQEPVGLEDLDSLDPAGEHNGPDSPQEEGVRNDHDLQGEGACIRHTLDHEVSGTPEMVAYDIPVVEEAQDNHNDHLEEDNEEAQRRPAVGGMDVSVEALKDVSCDQRNQNYNDGGFPNVLLF